MLYVSPRSIETNQVLMDITWKYYLRENGQKHWYIEFDDQPEIKKRAQKILWNVEEKLIEKQLESIL